MPKGRSPDVSGAGEFHRADVLSLLLAVDVELEGATLELHQDVSVVTPFRQLQPLPLTRSRDGDGAEGAGAAVCRDGHLCRVDLDREDFGCGGGTCLACRNRHVTLSLSQKLSPRVACLPSAARVVCPVPRWCPTHDANLNG